MKSVAGEAHQDLNIMGISVMAIISLPSRLLPSLVYIGVSELFIKLSVQPKCSDIWDENKKRPTEILLMNTSELCNKIVRNCLKY